MSETFRKFKQAAKSVDLEIQSYTGRAMYGRQCVGIVFDRFTHSATVVYRLCLALGDIGEQIEDYAEIFEGTREDSMGLDGIIYFPKLMWERETVEDLISDLEDEGFIVFQMEEAEDDDKWYWEPDGIPEERCGPFDTDQEAVDNCLESREP